MKNLLFSKLNKNRAVLLFLSISVTVFLSVAWAPPLSPEINLNDYKLRTVVIDAGHGGKDLGAHRQWAVEKNITLAIALKLGKYIKTSFPDIQVIYTRETDVFVELSERADIANRNKADLFISIHGNSSKNTTSNGTETYAFGIDSRTSQEKLEVAKRENAVILLEDDYQSKYDGFDPNSAEAYIIFSLYQNRNLDKSLNIASKIEDEFESGDGRLSRGVKQERFLVLRYTNMPAILVETGFISHRKEGSFIASGKGQDEIAASIYRAFKKYKTEQESSN